MLFFEALKLLHEGHSVRRQAWPDAEGYLQLLPGMKFIWKIVLVPNPNAGNFIFSLDDFESNDWVMVDPVNPFPDAIEAPKAA